MAQIRIGFEAFETMGLLLELPCYLTLVAEIYSESGAIELGLRAVADALKLSRRTADCFADAETHRVTGKLVLAQDGNIGRAVASLEIALRTAEQQNAKSWQLRSARDLARLWADSGERRKALDLLFPVYDWFTEGFDSPDLKDAKTLLDELA